MAPTKPIYNSPWHHRTFFDVEMGAPAGIHSVQWVRPDKLQIYSTAFTAALEHSIGLIEPATYHKDVGLYIYFEKILND